jgi:hypothetical protein
VPLHIAVHHSCSTFKLAGGVSATPVGKNTVGMADDVSHTLENGAITGCPRPLHKHNVLQILQGIKADVMDRSGVSDRSARPESAVITSPLCTTGTRSEFP